mgnify:CR=1 FL=1|jgi:hypothetical protein
MVIYKKTDPNIYIVASVTKSMINYTKGICKDYEKKET